MNHSLFWENLAPKSKGGGAPPSGELAKAIDSKVGFDCSFVCRACKQVSYVPLVGKLRRLQDGVLCGVRGSARVRMGVACI